MKILVTGYSSIRKSFIPTCVAKHLESLGHEVDGWSYRPNYESSFFGETWSNVYKKLVHANEPGIDWDVCPITKYDLVIHLGALSSTTEPNTEKVMEWNFDFTLWLLNECQKKSIPLHYASSASVYGQTTHFQEEGNLDPQTPYAWSKYLIDRIVTKYSNTFAAPVIGFRYFNVYGPGQESHKGDQASVFSKWEREISERNTITLFENSNLYKRDFIHIKDVCKIHEKMLNVDYKGVVNVGTGVSTSFYDIAEKYSVLTNSEIHEIDFPNILKNHYQKYTCSDNYQLEQLIGEYKFISVSDYFDDNY